MTYPRPSIAPAAAIIIPIRKLDEAGIPIVVRRRGRPRRAETMPTISESAYGEILAEAAERSISEDEVVVATASDDPMTIVDRAMRAIAEESAALLFERQRATAIGKSIDALAVRRTNALLRLADLSIARSTLEREGRDPKPEHVKTVLGLILDDIEDVVEAVAPPETAAMFVAALREKIARAEFSKEVSTPPTPTTVRV
ncbi:MAG: hypothetical protein ACHREM_11695 [Polyangiales bacterium]